MILKINVFLLIAFTSTCFFACDDLFGVKENHPIPSEATFLLKEGDTLTYQCAKLIEKFDIAILVDGKYYEYRSGTCGKGALDIIDFQAIFIKPIDSLKMTTGIGTIVEDCYGPPGVKDYYISIVKNLVHTFHSQGISYDADLCWFNDFHALESSSTKFHKSINLNDKQYNNVYEYDISKNENSKFEILYYTKHFGFIAYKLKNGSLYNLIRPEV